MNFKFLRIKILFILFIKDEFSLRKTINLTLEMCSTEILNSNNCTDNLCRCNYHNPTENTNHLKEISENSLSTNKTMDYLDEYLDYNEYENDTFIQNTKDLFLSTADKIVKIWHCFMDTYQEPTLEDIHLYLYTRKSAGLHERLEILQNETVYNNCQKYSYQEILDTFVNPSNEIFTPFVPEKSYIRSKYFNLFSPTKLIIHGYSQNHSDNIITEIRKAYLQKGNYNVIIIDWSYFCKSPCYRTATRNVVPIGKLIARFLDFLWLSGVSTKTIHLIGFSLGAQVAGVAGYNMKCSKLTRITGLDPALPYFRNVKSSQSLDVSDADFVDILHTDSGIFGQSHPIGHADFYPNGGTHQPGCNRTDLSCAHNRAAHYFSESIISEIGFLAVPCSNWEDFINKKCTISYMSQAVLMGEPCQWANGTYYLLTSSHYPYAMDAYNYLILESNDNTNITSNNLTSKYF